MRMTDLISKKRDGGILTSKEIYYMIEGYTHGSIPDYQMSAMLMAMYFQGLNIEETVDLTMCMMHSGDTLDLSSISGLKADKHSTGGVGDKTSLVLCPMVAACGVKMAKMSGRGLGHTGGTIDKLESIPGFSCEMTTEKFLESVEKVGIAIAGQTNEIDPADKMLYSLRDVTGTVPVRGLIVSSIMSKKLAAGADVIVLDVKCGSGTFMKTEQEARLLAQEMVTVGNSAGKKTVAVITDMDKPLGYAVGNALEVKEAISTLKGESAGELLDLCIVLGSHILELGGIADSTDTAKEMLMETIRSGRALAKFAEFVENQGGDPQAVWDVQLLPSATIQRKVIADDDCYIHRINTEGIGIISMHLGGGRENKNSIIDPAVGIVLSKKTGDYVKKGDTLATIYANSPEKEEEAVQELKRCFLTSKEPFPPKPFIKGIIR